MDDMDSVINDLMEDIESDYPDEPGEVGVESSDHDEENLNEFEVISVEGSSDGVYAEILAVFDDVDISPLTYDGMTDDDASTNHTVVFWEVDNTTDSPVTYGNEAITYVLDNRLKISPVSGSTVVWDPAEIGPIWNRAPSPGSAAEVEPGLKTRWVSIVDIPDSYELASAILNSYEHDPIGLRISTKTFADESNLPF